MSYSLHPSRNKRDAGPHEPSFYKLDAFGLKHHLKLKRNEYLMAPNLTIVSRNSDGTTTKHPAPQNTFYLGHVVSDPRSTVAVSNDGALVSPFVMFVVYQEINLTCVYFFHFKLKTHSCK